MSLRDMARDRPWTCRRKPWPFGTLGVMARQAPRPEDIIGEWGVRDVTPPSQRERARLESEADLNPLVGKPLRRRLRNFRPEADNYLVSMGGPLPYMERLREIEQGV